MTSAEAIELFDRRAWRLHRERAARSGCIDFLHAEVAERLVDRLDDVSRQFHVVLDLGVHNGALSRTLARRPGMEWVVAADPSLAVDLAGFAHHTSSIEHVVLLRKTHSVTMRVLHFVGPRRGTRHDQGHFHRTRRHGS